MKHISQVGERGRIAMPPAHRPDDKQAQIARARQEVKRRWQNERAALLAENVEICPFCDRELPPRVLSWTGQWIEPEQYDSYDDVLIRRRTSCGCEQERAAVAAQEARQEQVRKDRRREAWAWALAKAGLTGTLAKTSLDTYEPRTPQQRQNLNTCRRYVHDMLRSEMSVRDCPWLVLYGQYGTGKTHLAAAIVREALANGWHDCYFRPWLSYLRRLLNSFDEDARERTADITRELAAGRLVAIDDIDNDRANVSKSGFAETELFRALDERYREGLPTVLTFNRHPLEMTPWLGASGVDRVMHYSYASVQFDGISYRSGQDWGAPSRPRKEEAA